MKKSVENVLRLVAQFERKLVSLADNPSSDDILNLQKAITQLLGQDSKAKSIVDKDLSSTVNIGTSSGGGSPWTPGPMPHDEDSYLGERTKRAVYQLSRLYSDIPNVGSASIPEITGAIISKMRASYQTTPNRSQ